MICYCQCHRAPDDYWREVQAADPLEAAVACAQCKHTHCEALLDTKVAHVAQDTAPWKDANSGDGWQGS